MAALSAVVEGAQEAEVNVPGWWACLKFHSPNDFDTNFGLMCQVGGHAPMD